MVHGMLFLLRWFTAGGILSDWRRDFLLLSDESDTEITQELWETYITPGTCVRLSVLGDGSQGTLRDMFISGIEDVLTTSKFLCLAQANEVTVDEISLMVGAAPSQVEVRHIIAMCMANQMSLSCSTVAASTTSVKLPDPSVLCIICRRTLPTLRAMVEHVRSHLVELRCPVDCMICDGGDLPYVRCQEVLNESCSDPSVPDVSHGVHCPSRR